MRKEKTQPAADAPAAQHYCFNIADAAADARLAWQRKSLSDIEADLDKRIALLEAKSAEVKEWIAKREEMQRKAQEGLTRIYARMKPDVASKQVAAMDEETAVALLLRLEPKAASGILAEMDPARAAKLTLGISAAQTGDPPRTAQASPITEKTAAP